MKNLRKYQPWNAKSQNWEFIENRFITYWPNHKQMIELVQHIRNTNLKNKLFGSTSMDKLVISIYHQIDYSKESLHITFNLHSNKWNFKYIAMPFQKPKFVRSYDEQVGIQKFDKFIEMIKW